MPGGFEEHKTLPGEGTAAKGARVITQEIKDFCAKKIRFEGFSTEFVIPSGLHYALKSSLKSEWSVSRYSRSKVKKISFPQISPKLLDEDDLFKLENYLSTYFTQK